MPSDYEQFWKHESFALVGNSARKSFPRITYAQLKRRGQKVFAVDPAEAEVEGDRSYPDLESLPEPVEAVVLELPKDETAAWMHRVADAGIRNVWIHMGRDTPEALAVAEERGLEVLKGTCAVMYLIEGFTYHSIHRWLRKLIGRY